MDSVCQNDWWKNCVFSVIWWKDSALEGDGNFKYYIWLPRQGPEEAGVCLNMYMYFLDHFMASGSWLDFSVFS